MSVSGTKEKKSDPPKPKPEPKKEPKKEPAAKKPEPPKDSFEKKGAAPKNAPELNPPSGQGAGGGGQGTSVPDQKVPEQTLTGGSVKPLEITVTQGQGVPQNQGQLAGNELAMIGHSPVIGDTLTIGFSGPPVEVKTPPTPIPPSELAERFGLEDPSQPPPVGPVKPEGPPVCVAEPPAPPPTGPTIGPASPEAAQGLAVQKLEQAQAQYDAAKAQVAELDKQLAAELSHVGPSLTKDQQAEYIKAYHEAHPEYAQVEKAAANLEEALANPTLQDAIKADPKAAQAAYQGLKSLADSPLGGQALEIAKGWKADGATWNALSSATPEFHTRFQEEVLAPGLSAAAALDISNGLPLPEVASHAMETLDGFGALAGMPRDVVRLLEKISDGILPDTDEFQALVSQFDSFEAVGRSAGGLAALLSLGMAGQSGKEGDYLGALSQTANGAALGLPVLAEIFRTGKWGMYLPNDAKFLQRMTPVIGTAASALATYQDWMALQDPNSPKVGAMISLLGDAASTVGAAMELFPATAPAGALLNATGTLVAMGGYAVTQFENRADRLAEERALLAHVFKSEGVPYSKAEAMADAIVRDVFPRGNGDPAAAQAAYQPAPVATPRPPPVEVPPAAAPTPPPLTPVPPLATPIPIRG